MGGVSVIACRFAEWWLFMEQRGRGSHVSFPLGRVVDLCLGGLTDVGLWETQSVNV